MRATGIVRRIDELGRVVIPREVLRSMKAAGYRLYADGRPQR